MFIIPDYTEFLKTIIRISFYLSNSCLLICEIKHLFLSLNAKVYGNSLIKVKSILKLN